MFLMQMPTALESEGMDGLGFSLLQFIKNRKTNSCSEPLAGLNMHPAADAFFINIMVQNLFCFNSSVSPYIQRSTTALWPGDAQLRRRTCSTIPHVMAHWLFDVKSISETDLLTSELSQTNFGEVDIKIHSFPFKDTSHCVQVPTCSCEQEGYDFWLMWHILPHIWRLI